MLTCEAWSAASKLGSAQTFARLRRCSSAAGTRRRWIKSLPICATSLGPAIGQQAYKAYRDVLESDRWQRLENSGAHAQRLLFASTGTKDPKASDVLYIGALAAPNTVDTMPEETLLAFGEHGNAAKPIARDGGDCEQVLSAFTKAGD